MFDWVQVQAFAMPLKDFHQKVCGFKVNVQLEVEPSAWSDGMVLHR